MVVLSKDKYLKGILLYKFAWLFAVSFDSKFYIKTNKSLLSEFTKDWEIHIISVKSSSKIQESSITLLYQNQSEEERSGDTYLKIDSKIDLKPGFSDMKMDSIQYLLEYIKVLPSSRLLLQWLDLTKELSHINNNREKCNLNKLENRQYLFDLDIHLITKSQNIIRTQINNLSLFSNTTGFRLTSESKAGKFKELDINALILVNNYIKPTEFITNYLFNLGKSKAFTEGSRGVYKEAIKYFLKTISDYPTSNSNDLSFEILLNYNNNKKGKIGTAGIDKIVPLYYLALYKMALENIPAGESIEKRIHNLVPDFNEHPCILKTINDS